MILTELNESQQVAVAAFWEAAGEDSYEFSDNYRYAIPGDEKSCDEYEQSRAAGCCGFFDTELTCSDGSTIMFGFNYGH